MAVSVPAHGWQIGTDVAPEWLFVRLERQHEQADPSPPIADTVWQTAQEHGLRRLVLELGEATRLSSYLIGQIVLLHKRFHLEGGVVRLCGLSEHDYSVIQLMQLADRLPNYPDREAAVMGYRP